MLRALLEREIRPDLVLGTSVGALNGALVARDPTLAVIDRLTELWRSASEGREVYGDRRLRTVRRAVATGTHLYSAEPLRQRLEEEFGDLTFEELPVRFQVCAASIERAAEHWFDTGRLVDAVVASAAVPGLLPPAKVGDEHYLDGGIVNSIPVGRAVQLGATRIFVLQVGRIDRPLKPPRRPWEVARVSFEIARRHRFVRELAELPDDVECPRAAGPRHLDAATTRCSRTATSPGSRSGSTRRTTPRWTTWTSTCEPRATWALRRLRRRARASSCSPSCSGSPLPLWLVAAAALSPLLPGPLAGAAAALGRRCSTSTIESLMLVVLFGLWLASGFGWRMRSPYFAGHPLRPGAGRDVGALPGGQAGAPPRHRHRGPTPDAHPGKPILVCCRHAGPGDSFTLIHALMHWYDREPRVVLKDTLAVGPGDRRAAEPDPGPVHLAQPGGGGGPRVADRGAGHRPGRERRVRDLPRGRQLHPEAPASGRSPGCASSGLERMAVRAEQMTNVLAPRPGRLPRRAGRRPGRRRRPGRAHRPRPPAHRRRRVARAADGQADRDALVAGAARGDPGRTARNGSTGSSAGGSGSTPG